MASNKQMTTLIAPSMLSEAKTCANIISLLEGLFLGIEVEIGIN